MLQRANVLLEWFTTPGVVPWVGAVAAIAAALTVDSRTWVKSPVTAAGRGFRVILVWLVAVWLLGLAFAPGSGRGRGPVGSGTGEGEGAGAGDKATVVTVPSGPPGGTPPNALLVISFVSSEGNPAAAREFACDLYLRGTGRTTDGTKTEIRAPDMQTFDRLLVHYLRGVTPSEPSGSEVKIRRTPFPGEPALRRVEEKVRTVIPTATVRFDE